MCVRRGAHRYIFLVKEEKTLDRRYISMRWGRQRRYRGGVGGFLCKCLFFRGVAALYQSPGVHVNSTAATADAVLPSKHVSRDKALFESGYTCSYYFYRGRTSALCSMTLDPVRSFHPHKGATASSALRCEISASEAGSNFGITSAGSSIAIQRETLPISYPARL